MDDTLDAYIVAASMHRMQMDELDSHSNRNQPLFSVLDTNTKYQFLRSIAKEILDNYIKVADSKY